MTKVHADLPQNDRENIFTPSMINLIPFVLLIISSIVVVKFGAATRSTSELAFQQDPSRIIVLGITYFLALILFLIHIKERFVLLVKNKIYLALLIYILFSMLWSSFPIKVIINWGHYIGLTLVVISASHCLSEKPNRFFWILSILHSIIIVISIPVSLFVPSIGIDLLSGRWQGVAGNSNSLGINCLISIWSNVACLYLTKNNNNKICNIFMLLIALIALIGTRSTTSITVAVFMLACLFFFSVLEKSCAAGRILKVASALLVIIFIYAAVALFYPEMLTLKGSLNAAGRDATLTGRIKLWEIAWKLILKKPMLGWSFDSSMSAFNYLLLDNIKYIYGQFHNGYLDLLVRGGITGLMLFLFMIGSVFWKLCKSLTNNYRLSIIYMVMLFAILIHNITEASIVRETHEFWVIIVYISFSASVMLEINGTSKRRLYS